MTAILLACLMAVPTPTQEMALKKGMNRDDLVAAFGAPERLQTMACGKDKKDTCQSLGWDEGPKMFVAVFWYSPKADAWLLFSWRSVNDITNP